MNTRPVSIVPPGISFARYALALMAPKINSEISAAEFAMRWKDTPQVQFAHELRLRQKGDVGAGAIGEGTWGGPLANSGISGETLPLLRPLSVFEAARSKMRELPFLLQTPRTTDGGTGGGWVAEGAPIPLVSFAFDTLQFDVDKLCALVVVSKELKRFGGPVGEALLRDTLLTAFAAQLDESFLDPANSGGLASPASITYGATAVVQSGVTAAAMTTDLSAMIAAITTSGLGLTWLIKATTAARIAVMLGGAAASIPRSLFGLPIIISANVGPRIVLADLAEVAYAAGDLDVDDSGLAAVEMLDNPTNQGVEEGSPGSVVHTSMVSMWQANCLCLRVLRYLNWERVRTGSVSYMAVSY